MYLIRDILIPPIALISIYYFRVIADGEVLFRVKINTKFPVDLYALMDLSGSMDVYRKNLIAVAKTVAEKIKNDTNDFRLGFGGFRDKPRSPFGLGNFQIGCLRIHF